VWSTAHSLKVPIALASEWLLGFVAAVEFHVSVPQSDPWAFRDFAPSIQGLLIAPTLEDVDPLRIDHIRTDRQVKAAILLPRPSDHVGERFYDSVALVLFGARVASYDNHESFSFPAIDVPTPRPVPQGMEPLRSSGHSGKGAD
jgi:hypothetical protein